MALATFWQAITIAVVVTGATALGSGSSSAHPSVMLTGGITSQPIGHYNYCQRFLGECAIRPEIRQPHSASLEFLRTLRDVTVAVNLAIRPVSDSDLYGVDEFWTLPDGAGDCEDYVLQKQRILAAKGISRANLLITVLRKPDGEGHAILTVRTTGGDFVLDNLNDEVKPWDETGYTYLKRQASDHTGRWVTIEDGHGEPLVASIR
jgi:predicted transglutaminase-like cysteine proteinase